MTLIAVWMVVRESRILSQKSDNEVKWQIVLSFAFQTKSCTWFYSHPFPLGLTMPITPPLEFLKHMDRLGGLKSTHTLSSIIS